MMMMRRMMTMIIFMIIKIIMMIPGLSSLFVTVEALLDEVDRKPN